MKVSVLILSQYTRKLINLKLIISLLYLFSVLKEMHGSCVSRIFYPVFFWFYPQCRAEFPFAGKNMLPNLQVSLGTSFYNLGVLKQTAFYGEDRAADQFLC